MPGLAYAADKEEARESKIEAAFRDALYAEEVKGDIEAALKAYQDVATQFKQQRELAAKALFRQGECLRKLNRQEEAAELYQDVLRLYPDSKHVAKLSRENLSALGVAVAAAKTPGTAENPVVVDGEATEIARLQKLVENSPDLLNAGDGVGKQPPLILAAARGQIKVVTFLLDKGADINIEATTQAVGRPTVSSKFYYGTALHVAAQSGHKAICELLLDRGADIESTLGATTPLVLALNSKRKSVAQSLLQRGAKATSSDEGGSPLMAALEHEPSMVPELLKRGADPNIDTQSAGSGHMWQSGNQQLRGYHLGKAIHLAVQKSSIEILKALLDAGADPNAETKVIVSSGTSGTGRSGAASFNRQLEYGQPEKLKPEARSLKPQHAHSPHRRRSSPPHRSHRFSC